MDNGRSIVRYVFFILFMSSLAAAAVNDSCSFHEYFTCDDDALCIEKNGKFDHCECKPGFMGDGYKGNNQTGCSNGSVICEADSGCFEYNAVCVKGLCQCPNGFEMPTGTNVCEDINECERGICDVNAHCYNSPGSYRCACKEDYKGDGIHCAFKCTDSTNCHRPNGRCVQKQCQCKKGYEGDGRFNCSDINECENGDAKCDANAECMNNPGDYECVCKPGFYGNGKKCTAYSKTCDEILQKKKSTKSGLQTIDPDGAGPLEPVEVECDMRKDGIGVTIIEVTGGDKMVTPNAPDFNLVYEASVQHIKKIANLSEYCYQTMSASCRGLGIMLNGDIYWVDGQGNRHYTWGGSTVDGSCLCGQMGFCENKQSHCNCDGTENMLKDSGTILNRSLLPIQKVHMGLAGKEKFKVSIDKVVCGPRPFDIPKDCDEAKYKLKKTEDGPQVIDADGPEGPADPVLVHCDMESYPHVGITVVPHTLPNVRNLTGPGEYPVTYTIEENAVKKIVENSKFCIQEATYNCKNSGLQGTYFTSIDNEKRYFFPGSLGQNDSCPCGLTETCADSSEPCNCNLKDGQSRKDIGVEFDKTHLPITSMYFGDVGNDAEASYELSPLKCSQQSFYFEANCEGYNRKGNMYSYTYMIDPDGPEPREGNADNVGPFPVECKMVENPPHGITIIHHTKENSQPVSGIIGFQYKWASQLQLQKVILRAVYCIQPVTYTCNAHGHVHDASGDPLVYWKGLDGEIHEYLHGTDGSACLCSMTHTCKNGANSCNCDGATQTSDSGKLMNKDHLPVMNFTFVEADATNTLQLGPLQCFETHPTCSHLFSASKARFASEKRLPTNKEYTIDPDGTEGVEPFVVICKFPQTIIPISPDATNSSGHPLENNPVEKCFSISYNNGITPDQIRAVIEKSDYCTQHLSFNCRNAILTDHVYYKNCEDEKQIGWGGSGGLPKCSCGVSGTCDPGTDYVCNCDVEDGVYHTDEGWIHNKTQLPVCEVCMTLNPLTTTIDSRSASYKVSDLYCNSSPIGLFPSCQDRRDAKDTDSNTVFIDPDGYNQGNPPFPVYCRYQASPPYGLAEIIPKNNTYPVPPNNGTVIVLYFVFEISYVIKLVEESVYCEQEVYLLCGDAEVPIDGRGMDDWDQAENGSISCKDGVCQCNGDNVFGGYVTYQSSLPVQTIQVPPGTVGKIAVKPMQCYNVYKDCHEIKLMDADKNPNRNDEYAIDPDRAGGVAIFPVTCDFKTDPEIGITRIVNSNPDDITVTGQRGPNEYTYPVTYPDVSVEQIHVLANVSNFCYQGIEYECKNIPSMRLTTYGGVESSSVGTGFQSTEGCPCTVTDTCPEDTVCHCDAKGPMVKNDYGWVTDTDVLPVEGLRFGEPQSPVEEATAKIGGVNCGPRPFDIPQDCEDAYAKGYKSGEILVSPSRDVTPFFVTCDMDTLPGHGITIIGHDKETPTTLDLKNDTLITLTYNNVTYPQVEAITEISQYCFQPVKYDCFGTQFVGYRKFYWNGRDNKELRYFGDSDNNMQSCTCGKYGLCGGNVETSELGNRKCSCDAMEEEWRSDGGVIKNKDDLPVRTMTFLNNPNNAAEGTITVGKLYCSQVEYNPDECDMKFDDCHDLADCHDTTEGFECYCRDGFRGVQRDPLWANGRNCYDDDECANLECPFDKAYCNNTFGSFNCTCKEGYTQESKTECNDINECLIEGSCSEHADCFNRPGTYACRCKRGFRGDGHNCTSIGLCTCFGDPHCTSFDGKWLHFQGDCQYTMATDGCNGEAPTFEVRTKHWNQNIDGLVGATWVEEVEILLHSAGEVTTVSLKQDHTVWYNGLKYSVESKPDDHVYFKRIGNWIQVYTSIGLQVNWDGEHAVEVLVPHSFAESTCGLCGNYNMNPSDDWEIGDYCPLAGQITTNANIFGNSHVVADYIDRYPHCEADCNAPPPNKNPCTAEQKQMAKENCNLLFLNPHFTECVSAMPKAYLNGLIKSCQDDTCLVQANYAAMICDYAVYLVKECADNFDVIITDWRTPELCEPECGENMEYLYCGYPSQVKSCYDVRSTDVLPAVNDSCREGCFCKPGFYMDASGEECVPEDDCGCIYKGRYVSVGDSIVTENCEQKWTCLDTTKFSKEDIKCTENSTCKIQDGIYGCHCNPGYVYHGDICIFDPCGSNPCEEMSNTECKRIGRSYVCECQMGFSGDCTNCEDIDECKTRTDSCPKYSECKNTVGSYTCECRDGFRKNGDKCEDIKECDDDSKNNCGDGTKCYNTIGGYACKPCSDDSPDNKCCFCKGPRCKEDGPVCGTDGNLYSSEKQLIISRCEQNLKWHELQVNYLGHCKDACSNVECPPHQTCKIDGDLNIPMCECNPCDKTNPENTEKPVCTDTFRMYPNMCQFLESMCNGDTDSIPSFDTGPCEERREGIPATEWGPWSPCSETCGTGEKTRTRQFKNVPDTFYGAFNFSLTATAKCYNDPCPYSDCTISTCNATEVCEIVFVNGISDVSCECPDCSFEDLDPVCAKIGGKHQNFRNPCEARLEACESGEPLEILNSGRCGGTPLNCTLMPDYIILKSPGCENKRVNRGKCDGGCGPFANFCCNKVETELEDFTLNCNNNQTIFRSVDVTKKCNCERMPDDES